MQAQRTRNTTPELRLRRALHARGLRYRLHRRPVPQLRRTADIVFGPARVAVDVRGCFWHRCPYHGTIPQKNRQWWIAKLERNVARDADTKRRLSKAGWKLIVVWEHELPEVAASRVAEVVLSRRRGAAAR